MIQDIHKPISENNFLNTFDFIDCNLEIEVGWYSILWDLCLDLQKSQYSGKIIQIKEKFGRLTIYTSEYDETIDKIISEYEKKSLTLCELCGKKGSLQNLGWLKTLCDDCYNILKAKNIKNSDEEENYEDN